MLTRPWLPKLNPVLLGTSKLVGLAQCAQLQNPLMPGMSDGVLPRYCSEQTAREIDKEVKKLLDNAYAEAKTILHDHRAPLDLMKQGSTTSLTAIA